MRVKADILVWTAISFIWFLAVALPVHKIMFCVLFLMLFVFAAKEANDRTLVVPKTIILSILFQNTIIALACRMSGTASQELNIFTQIPFLEILCTSFWIFMKEFKKKKHVLFYFYLIIIAVYCLKGKVTSISVLLYNIRNLIVFYLAFVIGGYYIDNERKFNEMTDFYIRIAVFSGAFGIMAMIGGAGFYRAMGIAELYHIKSIGTLYFVDGLPATFYGDFFGTYRTRLASFFLEPVNYSSFMALAVILSACNLKDLGKVTQFLFLLACNMMTFGKGGLLIITLTMWAVIAGRLLPHRKRAQVKTVKNVITGFLIMFCAILGVYYGKRFSYNYHFFAIMLTFHALLDNVWGYGVGTVGNIRNMSSDTFEAIGAETGLLNFWCQIGIVGLLVFLMLNLNMMKNVIKKWRRSRNENIQLAFLFLPLVLVMVFIFQENIYTVQVITGYMLLAGYFSNPNVDFA